MKLTITKSQIKNSLNIVADAAQRSGTMPVLQNIVIRLEGGVLSMTASDMEAQISTHINCEGDDVAFTVPAAKLKAIVGTLEDSASISMNLKDEKLTVKSGKSRFNLQTLPVESFPLAETHGPSQFIELDQSQFRAMLSGVAHAMGNGHVRPLLNAVGFTSGYVAATDGARAAMWRHDFESKFNAIIPAKSVNRLIKLLSDGLMSAEIFEEKIVFNIGETELIVKLIAGQYPDIKRFFFDQNTEAIKVDRDGFLSCIQRASIQLPHHNGGILKVENGTLSIACRDGGQESSDEIAVEYFGKPMEYGYNLTFLADAVSAFDGHVAMHKGGNIDGALLITGESELQCVVTPMRI